MRESFYQEEPQPLGVHRPFKAQERQKSSSSFSEEDIIRSRAETPRLPQVTSGQTQSRRQVPTRSRQPTLQSGISHEIVWQSIAPPPTRVIAHKSPSKMIASSSSSSEEQISAPKRRRITHRFSSSDSDIETQPTTSQMSTRRRPTSQQTKQLIKELFSSSDSTDEEILKQSGRGQSSVNQGLGWSPSDFDQQYNTQFSPTYETETATRAVTQPQRSPQMMFSLPEEVTQQRTSSIPLAEKRRQVMRDLGSSSSSSLYSQLAKRQKVYKSKEFISSSSSDSSPERPVNQPTRMLDPSQQAFWRAIHPNSERLKSPLVSPRTRTRPQRLRTPPPPSSGALATQSPDSGSDLEE